MLQRRLIAILALAALLLWSCPADAGGLLKRVNLSAFVPLQVGHGARAIAMGSAYSPIGNDITAIWWNPAGLSGMGRVEATFTHTQWLVDSQFNAGAVGFRKGINAFAISFLTFSPGDVEETTILQPQGTGRNLDLGTTAVGLGYARQFTDKLSFGVRITYANERLDLVDYSTTMVDFGTYFHTGYRSVRLAMSMRNFGKDTEIFRRGFQQPLSFNLSAAGEIAGLEGDPFYLTTAVEMSFAINNEERVNWGGEAWLMNILALRAGYMFNYDAFDLTAGAGFKIPFQENVIRMDFAWQNSKNGLNVPTRFSVGFKF